MRDIVHNQKVTLAQASAACTGDGTGDIFDVKGFNSVMFAVLVAAVGAADASNYLTFTVQEGDSALGYDFADVAANRIISSLVINDTGMASSAQKLGVSVGIKRYMRLKWTETGTFSATFGAIAVLGNPEDAPVS